MNVRPLFLLPLIFFVSSCGLVKAPFRVAGAVVDGAYVGGKKVAKSTSDALEKRKLKKQKEEEEKAKAEAKAQAKPGTPPPSGQEQGPAIPVTPQPLPPLPVADPNNPPPPN